MRRRPVLFIEYSTAATATFDRLTDETYVLSHRRTLEGALLDRRHIAGFTALTRKRAAERKLRDALNKWNSARTRLMGWVFRKFVVMISTGNDGTDNNVYLNVSLTDGRQLQFRQIEPTDTHTRADYYFGSSHDDFSSNELDTYVVAPDQPVRWKDIRGFTVGLALTGGTDPRVAMGDKWRLARMRIIRLSDDGTTGLLLDKAFDYEFSPGDTHPEVPAASPPISDEDPEPVLTDFIATETLVLAELLMDHLDAFKAHYQAALLTDSDPVTRWAALADARLGTYAVTDLIDNTVLGSVGYEVAYPLTPEGDSAARRVFGLEDDIDTAAGAVAAEGLVGLPTRGVFAESKLGRCSACEHKDDTRYWDWQTSPIPETAPQIGAVDTGSRYQRPDALTPSAFPAPIVGIATPSPAPDPVAMANALQLLGKGDTFRDMSGMAQLGTFLSTMSKSTTDAVSSFARSQQQSQLADKILGSDALSGDQKGKLMGDLLGSSPSGQGDHAAADEPGLGPKTPADGGSEEQPPPTPPPQKPEPPMKPRQLKPSIADTITIRLEDQSGGAYRFQIDTVMITAPGKTAYGESDKDEYTSEVLISDNVNQVVLPSTRSQPLPRKGTLAVRGIRWKPDVLPDDIDSAPDGYWWNESASVTEYEFSDGSHHLILRMEAQLLDEIWTRNEGESYTGFEKRVQDAKSKISGGVETKVLKILPIKGNLGGEYESSDGTEKSTSDETSWSTAKQFHVYSQSGKFKWDSDGKAPKLTR
jgi:hypothetical protein